MVTPAGTPAMARKYWIRLRTADLKALAVQPAWQVAKSPVQPIAGEPGPRY